MTKHDGPKVRIDASCFDCFHERSNAYAYQSDSGQDVYCTHPLVRTPERLARHVGDTIWKTPEWCPLLQGAIDALIEERKARGE